MTEDEAYLCQAQSDWDVLQCLLRLPSEDVPICHPLHYLQMATEKLSKAVLIAGGESPGHRHDTFSTLLNRLEGASADLAFAIGWIDLDEFLDYLKGLLPLCAEVERLNPAVQDHHGACEGGRNVEYPWQENSSFAAPARHDFGDLDLRNPKVQRQASAVVEFVRRLFDYYPEVVEQLPHA